MSGPELEVDMTTQTSFNTSKTSDSYLHRPLCRRRPDAEHGQLLPGVGCRDSRTATNSGWGVRVQPAFRRLEFQRRPRRRSRRCRPARFQRNLLPREDGSGVALDGNQVAGENLIRASTSASGREQTSLSSQIPLRELTGYHMLRSSAASIHWASVESSMRYPTSIAYPSG